MLNFVVKYKAVDAYYSVKLFGNNTVAVYVHTVAVYVHISYTPVNAIRTSNLVSITLQRKKKN